MAALRSTSNSCLTLSPRATRIASGSSESAAVAARATDRCPASPGYPRAARSSPRSSRPPFRLVSEGGSRTSISS